MNRVNEDARTRVYQDRSKESCDEEEAKKKVEERKERSLDVDILADRSLCHDAHPSRIDIAMNHCSMHFT